MDLQGLNELVFVADQQICNDLRDHLVDLYENVVKVFG